jgi:hypothetical protein
MGTARLLTRSKVIVMGRALPSMPIPSIRRRLDALEAIDAWSLIGNYPAPTHYEVLAIEQRMRAGGSLSRAELGQLEQHSPIIDGELMMTCWKGRFSMKRYIGLDLAEL